MKNKIINSLTANQATGCFPSGDSFQFYNDKGDKITLKQAAKLFNEGETIETPSAGAGSYQEIFEMLGFDDAEDICNSSSAGDWTFGIKNKTGWQLAFQENRYPYHGFKYSIDKDFCGFAAFKDLCKAIEE